MHSRLIHTACLFALLAGSCSEFLVVARAAEPLRWKFAAGEELNFHIEQTTQLGMEGQAGPIRATIEQEYDASWKVVSVDEEEGNARISTRFDRLQTTMKSGDEERLEYDSADEEPPTGLGSMVLPMYDAIVGGSYEFTVTPRGEVRDVQIPEDVEQAIRKAPGTDAAGEEAAIEAFRAMLTQALIPLPDEAPMPGATWSTRIAARMPGCDSATVETEYRYAGPKEVNGTMYAAITPTVKLELAGNEQLKTRVKEQTSQGKILFDPTAGRLHSLELQTHASIDATIAGQILPGMIDQRTIVRSP